MHATLEEPRLQADHGTFREIARRTGRFDPLPADAITALHGTFRYDERGLVTAPPVPRRVLSAPHCTTKASGHVGPSRPWRALADSSGLITARARSGCAGRSVAGPARKSSQKRARGIVDSVAGAAHPPDDRVFDDATSLCAPLPVKNATRLSLEFPQNTVSFSCRRSAHAFAR